VLERALARQIVDSPEAADLILVTGDGMTSDEGVACIDDHLGKKRMIFLGPSAAGVSCLMNLEHWCPYGR
jgi:fructose-specific component phosphotransferase system IIB-like protein